MEMIRRRLLPGVCLTYLQEHKFKTNVLSAQLIVPLSKKTASANALLPAVLRRGTARYPDMQALSAALDRLYGARIDCTVRKKGENQCVGFVASFIDDRVVPGGEKLLEPVAEEGMIALADKFSQVAGMLLVLCISAAVILTLLLGGTLMAGQSVVR